MQPIILFLFTLASLNKGLLTCQTGVLPDTLYRATLDLSDNYMEYSSGPDHLIASGKAIHSEARGMEYYHLAFSFSMGAQLFYDGEEWWLCQSQNECLRCGQYLKP